MGTPRVAPVKADPVSLMEREISSLSFGPWKDGVPTILVQADKGGTGKSSVSINLAMELRDMGLKVGLVDADVDSPNIGEILGVFTSMDIDTPTKFYKPITVQGIQVTSSSFFVNREKRTSFAMSNCGKDNQQVVMGLVRCAMWDVDVLVVDCPAGTSDELNAVIDCIEGDPFSRGTDMTHIIGTVVVINPANKYDLERVYEIAFRQGMRILGVIENKKGVVSEHGSPVICSCGCGKPFRVYSIPEGTESIEEFCAKRSLIYLGGIPLIENYTREVLKHNPRFPSSARPPIIMAAGMIRAVRRFMQAGMSTSDLDDKIAAFLINILKSQGA